MMADPEDVMSWTCSNVRNWLHNEGLEQYSELFCDQHRMDGKGLLLLSEKDLKEPPMEIKVLGDIKRIVIALNEMKRKNYDAVHRLSILDTSSHLEPANTSCHCHGNCCPETPNCVEDVQHLHKKKKHVDGDSSFLLKTQNMSSNLKPEYLKCILSYIYMFLVFLLSSFVMVIVHDRVPDMEKYPPLPDLVLDNLPVIPWAFEMCELTASLLFVILAVIMFFHKHRFIIMRRLFSLTGTIFLLRCITMLITSLSVPGTHLKCEPRVSESLWVQLERTFTIWKGFGMSLQGVRSCGDYMFSGHTAIVTMLNFFITEYTPRKLDFLHTATWVMNIFGIFFILAAHEHYSIDVFISFYLTSRLFLYYHSLANNRALWQPDKKRMWKWFPMFSYFESKMNGILPNEYEWPLPSVKQIMKFCQNKVKRS